MSLEITKQLVGDEVVSKTEIDTILKTLPTLNENNTFTGFNTFSNGINGDNVNLMFSAYEGVIIQDTNQDAGLLRLNPAVTKEDQWDLLDESCVVTKKYVDNAIASSGGGSGGGVTKWVWDRTGYTENINSEPQRFTYNIRSADKVPETLLAALESGSGYVTQVHFGTINNPAVIVGCVKLTNNRRTLTFTLQNTGQSADYSDLKITFMC